MLAWEMVWPIAIAILGVALAWGVYRYHTRNRDNDRITEEATRALYKHPETYDETAAELKKELKR